MDEFRLSPEQLIRASVALTWRSWPEALGTFLLYFACGLLVQLRFGDALIEIGLLTLVACVICALFTLFLLKRLAVPLAGSDTETVMHGFAAGLFTGIAIILGFVLLIIPGVYLLVRWFVVVPVIMAEGGGVLAAARSSAQYVKGYFWSILGAYFLISLPYFLALGAFMALGLDEQPFVARFVLLPVEAALFVLNTCLAVVAFVEIREGGSLQKVFA